MMGMFGIWPAGVRRAAVRWSRGLLDNSADTGVLSNMGNLPQPLDFGAGAGAATELWGSPPALMPPGTGVGATTMNGEMFRHCATAAPSSTPTAQNSSRRICGVSWSTSLCRDSLPSLRAT